MKDTAVGGAASLHDGILELGEETMVVLRDGNLTGLAEDRQTIRVLAQRREERMRVGGWPAILLLPVENRERERNAEQRHEVEREGRADPLVEAVSVRRRERLHEQLTIVRSEHPLGRGR